MKWRNWLSTLLGAWCVIAPWAVGEANHVYAAWTSVVIGIVQVVVCAWAAVVADAAVPRTWQNWVAMICGFGFVVIPFMGRYEEWPYWATAGAGIITMALSLWTLMMSANSSLERGPRAPA